MTTPDAHAARTPDPMRDAEPGMRTVDTSDNPRLPVLMEMVGALSRATEPEQVVRTFRDGIARLHGPRAMMTISTRGVKPGEYRITRFLDDRDRAIIDSTDPWNRPGEQPVRRGGFFGHLIRIAYPELIHGLSVRDDPVVGDLIADYGCLMAIPLFDNGEPLNWVIFFKREPEGFSVEELEDAILRSNLVGRTVQHVLMTQQLREAHRRIDQEVEQIAAIQRALLPERMPDIPGASVEASYRVFEKAGGDLYDIAPLDGRGYEPRPDVDASRADTWALLIADASGHGPAAAVVMAMLHSILRAYPDQPAGPAEVLNFANHHLCAKRIESSFVTAFLAFYEPATRRLTYARAGHNPPLLKPLGEHRPSRRLDDVGGVPLGVLPDVRYDTAGLTLEPGQTLVMYTDGITEAMDRSGEMFGVDGVERAINECSGEADCVIRTVNAAVLAHADFARPSDDQTILAMQITE